MQTLATITTVFAFVAIAIHVYIWIIESLKFQAVAIRNIDLFI